ncbi:hypothetical protein [Hydrogenimonas cancrithermarum]|uniref:Uncharacterized protein n=1 Tax=Hydrogenimonas cancrithermarum TaxID=2993563 RepID=A0ABM8FKV6_9BACT|nr:hypothetical protein [Hydrogenimonas cancrithermarum]BDY12002.1 hypothetical protein HCR_03140 [Hydrogenimonas cancrithermarum]
MIRWHEAFKIALIEENERELVSLLEKMPKFEHLDEMESALALIAEAKQLFEIKKKQLLDEMKKVRTAKKFLTNSEETFSEKKLDVHS